MPARRVPARVGALLATLERNEASLVLTAAALIAFRLWVMSLPAGYTLDETGLLFTIGGGWPDLWRRTTMFPQSLAFAAMTLLLKGAVGASGWLLRLPSLLASLLTAGLLYRLGARLADARVAAYGVLFWVCLAGTSEQASVIRPYALGGLAVLLSYQAFLRFLERPGRRQAVVFGLAAALPGYFSVFLGLTVVSQAVHALWTFSRARLPRPLWLRSILPFAIAGVASLPVLAQVLAFRGDHVYTARPGVVDLLERLAPPGILASFAAAGAFALLARFILRGPDAERARPRLALLLASWALVPLLVLFLVSWLTPLHVFLPRYHVGASLALALLWATLFRQVGRAGGRLLAATLLVAVSVRGYLQAGHLVVEKSDVDWRGGTELARRVAEANGLRVLATGAFFEAVREYPVGTLEAETFLAPYHAYGLDATVVPAQLWGTSVSYVSSISDDLARAGRPFLLVRHRYWDGKETSEALARRFRRSVVFTGNGIWVERFDPTLPAGPP